MIYRNFPAVLIKVTSSLFLLAFCSCKKFIEINPSPNIIETEKIFSNDNTAISAVTGVYTQIRSLSTNFTNGGLSIFTALSADEIYNTAANSAYDPFSKNQLLSTTGTINGSFWISAYRVIYRANAILEGLASSNLMTDSVKKQLAGEMKIVRALHYFYLVNLFGDVPLVISSNYAANAVMPRTPASLVYQQIITDLSDAQQLLKVSYPTPDRVRPNSLTATALLARVYLYQKNWEKAETNSTTVINSSDYALVTDLNSVFLKNSPETIWEMASPSESANTAQGSTFIPASSSTRPALAVTPSLLNSFEPGDRRRTSWIKANTVNGIVYNYPFKYKARSASVIAENLIVFRLSEQYLVRAEARAERNDVNGALEDLNIVRNRAGLSASIAITKEEILTAIQKERFTELFTEWGDRWLNLKRTNRANDILSPLKGANWQVTDLLYPIPRTELNINVFLVQNPGY